MKMILVISSLKTGGAERVLTMLANHWVEALNEIVLVTFDRSEEPHYLLDRRIRRIALLRGSRTESRLRLLKRPYFLLRLRRIIAAEKADVAISFIDKTNVIVLLASLGLGLPVIVSERVYPGFRSIGLFFELSRKVLYPTASCLVVQTERIKKWFEDRISSERLKIAVIPNPLPFQDERIDNRSEPPSRIERPALIAMGRLCRKKGFDLLLSSFRLIYDRYPDLHCYIIGEGELKTELIELAKTLLVNPRTHFIGRLKNPFPVLEQADIFVLSSICEGFPNALCEAMSLGLAVVSFDCPTGPAEIIEEGVNGYLVPCADVALMAERIAFLLDDPEKRRALGERAKEIRKKLSIADVSRLWDQVIAGKHPAKQDNDG